MTEFGELVLVLGDLHIPHRASAIPEKFQRMLVPHKMQHVLCTGNLGTAQQLEELKRLAPNVHIVRGDMDGPQTAHYPDFKVVTIGEFRIGLCHGHQVVPWGDPQALAMLQRQLDVDILVTGHTHRNEVLELGDGKWLINPGSITGAYGGLLHDNHGEVGGGGGGTVPSFVLLAVQGPKVVAYVYEEKGGQVDVSKIEFQKGVAGKSTTAAGGGGPA